MARNGARFTPGTAAPPAVNDASLPVDISFLARGTLTPQLLRNAAQIANRKGMEASEFLIHRGMITREAFERELARHTGAAYCADGPAPARLDPVAVTSRDELRVPGAIERGEGKDRLFVSPQASGYHRIASMAARAPATFRRCVFTGQTALRRSLFERSRQEIAAQAAGHLKNEMPHYSASRRLSPGQIAVLAVLVPVMCGGALIDWLPILTALAVLLSIFYLAIIVLRGVLIVHLDRVAQKVEAAFNPSATAPEDYPVYSILVALYREENQIGGLLRALDRLDWPRTKKEVFFICEEDDPETIAAIRAQELPEGFELVICPPGQPRTKPKALNFALPLCSGEFTVIYDAEDRPDALQLREAWQTFKAGKARLACLQAPLLVHNDRQNWLTRLFAIEYLALFRGTLPVLAGLRVPLPLGGTSNHFKTAILRAAGAWDPYNVTEDADLGIRLARLGWRCATISRPTWEEAPPRLSVWLKQRTRWQKGWLQTILVHSRQPVRAALEFGPVSALFFHLTITAIVVSALIHPFYLGLAAWQIADLVAGGDTTSRPLVLGISMFNLVGGYTTYSFFAYGVLAMTRNRLSPLWLMTLPIYWLLISLAGWRALLQFVIDPFRWEKTPHGLANHAGNGNI